MENEISYDELFKRLECEIISDEKNLTLDSKKEFKEVLNVLTRYNIPTDNYLNNLQTLEIITKIKTNERFFDRYNPYTNTIHLVENDSSLIHELFHMASSYKKGNEFPSALAEGIVEYFSTQSKLYNHIEGTYDYEMNIVERLSKIVGNDMYLDFFNNDYNSFLNRFGDKQKIIIDIANDLDKYKELMVTVASKYNKTGYEDYPAWNLAVSFGKKADDKIKLLTLKK